MRGEVFRGENGASLLRASVAPEGAVFEWIVNTNLKGNLPRRLVHSSMNSFFMDYVSKLRAYMHENARNNP